MKEEQTNRERRRRRRVRNQILAYLTLAAMAVLVAAVGYFGVRSVISHLKDYSSKVNQAIEEAEPGTADPEEDGYTAGLQTAVEESVSQEDMPAAEPEADPLDGLVESLLKDMTIEEMVAGMFIVSPESITGVGTAVKAGDGTKAALAENPVGGIVYSAKNFKSQEQFAGMVAKTKEFSRYPIFAAVRVESGNSPGFGMAASAKAPELMDAGSVREVYGKIAEQLALYGVNMNFAPVAEVVPEEGDAALRGRTFGSDAAAAAPLVNTAVQAMQEAGVSAVLQKFPQTEAGAKTLEEFKNSGFAIFDAAIKNGVDCILVSGAAAAGMTGSDTPACLSPVVVTDVLRNTMGFNGVVITDDLGGVTGNYDSAAAAVAAIEAGADMLLAPADYKDAYEGVLQAVADGRIAPGRIRESIYRVYRVKYKDALDSQQTKEPSGQ